MMTDMNTSKAYALEAYLVAAAKTGDRSACDQLVRLVSPRLLAHANRLLGDSETARDVVQAAWIDILTGMHRLQAVEAFRTFALRIVSRKVARVIKTKTRERTLNNEISAETVSSIEPLGEIAADATIVREAIDALPPTHRATLALFYLEDLSVSEVATAMDVPIGTVKTRLMHARSKLRAILKGETDVKN